MTAPQEAVQAVMGLLKCYIRHRPEVDVCGTCDSRELWTDRGCPVATSLADAVWAMAAHCGCEYCRGETTADGECGCEFCEHRRAEYDDESCPGCEECGGGRPSADALLGIAPEWTGELSVDEYVREQRRR